MLYKKMIAMFAVLFAFAGAGTATANEEGLQENTSPAVAEALMVNINEADAELLADLINGVGAKRAQAIIDYRNAHGPFKSVEELAQVKGIGEATIAKNRERIRLQ